MLCLPCAALQEATSSVLAPHTANGLRDVFESRPSAGSSGTWLVCRGRPLLLASFSDCFPDCYNPWLDHVAHQARPSKVASTLPACLKEGQPLPAAPALQSRDPSINNQSLPPELAVALVDMNKLQFSTNPDGSRVRLGTGSFGTVRGLRMPGAPGRGVVVLMHTRVWETPLNK